MRASRLSISVHVWIIIVTIPALARAIFGYKWIHQAQKAVRLAGILFIFVVGTILACLSSAHFYSSFENFIGVLLFFFVPWSAINLVDYYLVKHARYDVQSFFKPDGVYGGFQWWACICYVITLAVQTVP